MVPNKPGQWPAFPDAGMGQEGMSFRDYVAAHALQGVIAMHADPDCLRPDAEDAARWAVEYADALLAQLAK
jgi:hypothetical protein